MRIFFAPSLLLLLTLYPEGGFSIWSWRIGEVSLTAPAALVLLVVAVVFAWKRLMSLEVGAR